MVAAAWVLSVGTGLAWLWRYQYTPGKPISHAPAIRPDALNGTGGKPMIVVFAHPRCSCSEATLEQVARIQTQADNLDVRIFFITPAGQPDTWARTSLREQALRIPGAHVLNDPGGVIAMQYGAKTSGQILLFDADGRLAFDGGITEFRGHSGDNDGSDAVAAVLRRSAPRRRTTPVFGCDLLKRTS